MAKYVIIIISMVLVNNYPLAQFSSSTARESAICRPLSSFSLSLRSFS